MTLKNILTGQPLHMASLGKRMLIGGVIALILIILFLAGADYRDPAWPKFWMVRPLIIVPIAGAMGGAFSYFVEDLRSQGSWKTLVAILLSMIVYVVALWFGSVLGLDGTYWN